MKFISFNINGIRAHNHQLQAIIKKHQPDVIGLQETKVNDDSFPVKGILELGYHVYYYGQKSYYGVALLTKKKISEIYYGLPNEKETDQRRVIIAELPSKIGNITIINAYFPQGENRSHPIKFPAKKIFYLNLQKYLEKNFKNNKPILIMGDMNISPDNLDIGIGEENRKRWLSMGKCAFLPEEREWMQRLLNWGLIDTFRKKNPTVKNRFSWFDYRSHGFETNRGLRIDLILITIPLLKLCIETGIDYQIRNMNKPSDHAPIWTTFKLL